MKVTGGRGWSPGGKNRAGPSYEGSPVVKRHPDPPLWVLLVPSSTGFGVQTASASIRVHRS